MDAQADLSLCKVQMLFCWFCRAPAQDALLLLLLLQINPSVIAIATAAERKCRCVGFVVRRLRMHYNNNNNNTTTTTITTTTTTTTTNTTTGQCLYNCDFYMPIYYLRFNFTTEMLPAYIVAMATLCRVGFLILVFLGMANMRIQESFQIAI